MKRLLLAKHQCTFLLSLLITGTCCSHVAWAGDSEIRQPQPVVPWFTGTLLSSRGSTVDQGHVVVEPYFYFTRFGGLYNDNWRLQSVTVSRTIVQQTYFIYGLTSRVDVEIAPQWLDTHAQGESSAGFGDLPFALGYQVFRGRSDSWLPDVRIWAQEMFPTGRYTALEPSKTGLGGTGGGSYATTLGIGAQKLIALPEGHFLRYRVNITHGFYTPVTVRGFNAYGGGFGTTGRVDPGSVTTVTLAAEYTITQHLVFALDIGFQTVNATRFSGTTGVGVNGEPAMVGKGYSNLLTIAPAVEYHWNSHVALIAGPWMSLRGRNAAEFFGVVAALYLFI
ncbi:MAG TPA: hypothetical protein VJV04_15310 [Nitrospiraceae bacterium]|nr:hypothetical protein [Nitrospiraceae bacterium]